MKSILVPCDLGKSGDFCKTHERRASICLMELHRMIPKGRGGEPGCKHEKVERSGIHWRCLACGEGFMSYNDAQCLMFAAIKKEGGA